MLGTETPATALAAALDAEVEEQIRIEAPPPPKPRPVMAPEAFHGPLGQYVLAVEDITEADPPAMLGAGLTLFGSVIGRKPHWRASMERHSGNLFCALVGESGVGKKGTALNMMEPLFVAVDKEWSFRRIGGLESGQALVEAVRDPSEEKDKEDNPLDEGVNDKRLCIIEPEFDSIINAMERDGSTMATMLRLGWEGKSLATRKRGAALVATDPHISVLGGITPTELHEKLSGVHLKNGFANRFLWLWSYSDKDFPEPPPVPDAIWRNTVDLIQMAAQRAALVHEPIPFTPAASHIWGVMSDKGVSLYKWLRDEKRLRGMSGVLCARGRPMVRRLAMLYALLDEADAVDVVHMKAAMAVWEYNEATVRHVFGDTLGNPLADEILQKISEHTDDDGWLLRSKIYDYFGRNKRLVDIGPALDMLLRLGLVERVVEKTGKRGRPPERFRIKRGD